MNLVVLTGRLTADPTISVAGNTGIARFTVAVNRQFAKDGQQAADFINCVAFGKTAELMEKYWSKGMKADIRGRWQSGSYKDKEGKTVYTNDCVIENIEFGESKSKSGNSSQEPSKAEKPSADGFMNIPDGVSDEGLPFN